MSPRMSKTRSGFRGLKQAWQREGLGGVPYWGYRWLYWNTPFGKLAKRAGKSLGAFPVRDPIIVYQMGKVGSTSVFMSLKRMELNVPLYQLHFMSDLDKMERVTRTRQEAEIAYRQIEIARRIRAEMVTKPEKKWNLITLTRAPVPRLISVFFQGIDNDIPNAAERYQSGTLKLQQVLDYFTDQFREGWAEGWFDGQLYEPFGLDVFAEPFETARGFQIYRHGSLRFLIIRLEDLNRVASDAMREFLGLENFQLVQRNVGEDKAVGTLYRDFRTALRLSPEFVREMHSSRYARHFYTPQELNASIARWV